MFGGQAFGSPNFRMTNVDNIIRGNGELVIPEVGFTNRHIVQADTPGTGGQTPDLRFFNHGQVLINPGIMQAINGGRLRLSGGGASQNSAIMENFEAADAGEIIAGENSIVILNLIQINGGVLRAVGDDPATRGRFVIESGGTVLENLTTEGVFRFVTSSNPLTNPPLSTITLSKRIINTGSMTARFAISQSAGQREHQYKFYEQPFHKSWHASFGRRDHFRQSAACRERRPARSRAGRNVDLAHARLGPEL
jgi:hypothetical protein